MNNTLIIYKEGSTLDIHPAYCRLLNNAIRSYKKGSTPVTEIIAEILTRYGATMADDKITFQSNEYLTLFLMEWG